MVSHPISQNFDRPALNFFWPLLVCHLPPHGLFDLGLLLLDFQGKEEYSEHKLTPHHDVVGSRIGLSL
jgi:hypothetical protein